MASMPQPKEADKEKEAPQAEEKTEAGPASDEVGAGLFSLYELLDIGWYFVGRGYHYF